MTDESVEPENTPIIHASFARRHPLRLAGVAVFALIAFVLVAFAVSRARHRDRVLAGVVVSGVGFSGLGRAEAEQVCADLGTRLVELPLHVSVGEKSFELEPKALGMRVEVGRTVQAAFLAGRSGGIFSGIGFWVARFRRPVDLSAEVELDRNAALAVIDKLEAEAIARPFAGGVRVENGNVVADAPRRGKLVDRERALSLLAAAFARPERSNVELPLTEQEPFRTPGAVDAAVERARELTRAPVALIGESELVFSRDDLLAALRSREPRRDHPEIELYFDESAIELKLVDARKRLESPAADARFEVDKQDHVSIVPSRDGSVLEARAVAEALSQAAAAASRSGTLPVVHGAKPAVTTADLEALHVRGLVAKYTTFHACCQPRVDNIHHIADLLNGHVVKPGEEFSINAFIGPRTTKNGFKPAPTIEEGEMVEALGGGVSQFATTIFNALFLGGYDIIERVPHTYYFARYPMGRDATLSWPHPDIVFKNDTEAGAVIVTQYDDKSITVKIFGDNAGRKVSFQVSPQQDAKKPEIEYIPDLTQSPEKDKVKEGGQIGWTVFVTRQITFADGSKKEEKRKVVYKPRTRRVIVHPCKVPQGEPGYTGEKCPEPEEPEDGG